MASCLSVNQDIFDIFKVCDDITIQTINDGTYYSSKEEIRKIQIISCLDRLREIYSWNISNDKKMEILNDDLSNFENESYYSAQSYEDMTVAELRELATEKDIKISSNMKKSEIIEVIMESEV